jgi:putative transposase
MTIQPITEGCYYHIYNRGVNGMTIFREKKNYRRFLENYVFYCSKAIKTLSYCLLKNHFHLLVYINENVQEPRRDGKEGMFRLNASTQLGHCFNSYAQYFNKNYQRTGPVFESPFERKLLDDEQYIKSVISYCNRNAVHHGFVNDIREWEYSSYSAIVKGDQTIVATDEVISRYESVDLFTAAHQVFIPDELAEKYIIEF